MELIEKTYNSKEKIKDKNKLIEICKYINSIEKINIKNYSIGNLLNFTYFEIVPSVIQSYKIRPETIFKINIWNICNQVKKSVELKNIFKDIKINVEFEKSSDICKKYRKRTFIHDALIEISNKHNTFEVGFEYNEMGHSSKIEQDNMKNIYSIVCLDGYNIYCEKDKNYDKFMNNVINELLIYICSLNNSQHELAKILYFKDKKNIQTYDDKIIDEILNCMKNDKVSIKYLYDTFNPFYKDSDGENIEYEYDEYVNHLIDDVDIKIVDDFCNYENLLDILSRDINENNHSMMRWNRFFLHAMNKLNEAGIEIIKLNNKMNVKKKLMHPLFEDMLKNLHRYPNDSIVMIGINNFLREHGYTGQISEIEIFNIFDIQNINNNTIDNEIKEENQKESSETQIKNIVSDNKENINKIIKKYYRTTNKQHIEENVRFQLVTFFNIFFSMDKNNRYVDINKKKEIQQIFRDWSKKYYHTSGDRTIVFSLLKKILLL